VRGSRRGATIRDIFRSKHAIAKRSPDAFTRVFARVRRTSAPSDAAGLRAPRTRGMSREDRGSPPPPRVPRPSNPDGGWVPAINGQLTGFRVGRHPSDASNGTKSVFVFEGEKKTK